MKPSPMPNQRPPHQLPLVETSDPIGVGSAPKRGAYAPLLAALVIATVALSACGSDSGDVGDVASDPASGGVDARSALPLTWENVFSHGAGVSSATLSPNGDFVALVQTTGGTSAIRIEVTADRRTSPQQASAPFPGHSPSWSPDGKALTWVHQGRLWRSVMTTDIEAQGATAPQISLGEPKPLTESIAGIRNPVWSPLGDAIAFFAAIGPASENTDPQEATQDLWLVDVDSRAVRRLTSGAAVGDDTRFAPQWSPDGAWLAMISNSADWWHDDVFLVDASTGDMTHVSTTFMASSSPVFSPSSTGDKATLVAMGTAKDGYWYQDLADLFRIEVDLSGSIPRTVSESAIEMQVFATDFIMRFDPYFSADGEWVYFPYHERGAFDLWSVPTKGGVATRVTNLGGAWSSLDADSAGDQAVFVRDAPTEGREAWLISSNGGPARRLTGSSPRFANVQVPREISFRSFDGLYIQGFLYLPNTIRESLSTADDQDSGYSGPVCPALVQVHGGGTNSYYQGTNLTEQVLADHGFPVLAINYRGGSGFGREFQDLNIEDWLNDQSKDPGAAADWLRAQPWSNGKVGIYGGSYGGMQSMSAITRTPDKFDAAVPMRGIYSEALTLPFADRLGQIFTITGHGGTPEERPEIYAKSETLDRMNQITAPVLIMHGERDVRAPFKNFELAVERLEALGKEFEAKTYPEGHGFRNPANLTDMYENLELFFRKHLGECS